MRRLLRHPSAGPVSPSGRLGNTAFSHRSAANRLTSIIMLVLAPFALALAVNVLDYALGSPVSRLLRTVPRHKPDSGISYITPDALLSSRALVAVRARPSRVRRGGSLPAGPG
jgi:hypothetical protein